MSQDTPDQPPPETPGQQPPPPGPPPGQPPAAPPGPAFPPQPAFGTSGAAGLGPVTRTSGQATASLVLGIAGILCCPLICSILAIVFGSNAKKEIAANPSIGGLGMAQAGWIMGIIGTVLGALGLVIWIIAVAAGGN